MPGAKITKIKFYSINRDVKAAVAAANYDAEEIGRKHFVSRETVNAVRRAGTWPQWERNKAEANRRRVERAKAAVQPNALATVSTELTGVNLESAVGGLTAMQAAFQDDEDTVTITRRRFHYFLDLERRAASGITKSAEEQPKRKLRLWGRR